MWRSCLLSVVVTVGLIPAASAQPVPIVYARCPRHDAPIDVTADVVIDGVTQSVTRTLYGWDLHDTLPDVTHFLGDFNAPCDLVLRQPSGVETVLYDCTSTSTEEAACAAMDPAVSFDGRTIAFTVFRGRLRPHRVDVNTVIVDPRAERQRIGYLPSRTSYIEPTSAQLHLVDVATGAVSELPMVEGEIDAGPAFLPNGRLMFTSTRDGHHAAVVFTTVLSRRGTRPWVMDLDGRNVELVGADSLGIEEHPFVLMDGRVAVSSWQMAMGIPFRHGNNGPGTFGTIDNRFAIFARNPDGSHIFAMFGQHIGGVTTAVNHTYKAAHFLTQGSDGRVWFADYYRGNNFGLGNVDGFMPEPEGQEGIGPAEHPAPGDLYVPRDLITLARWSSSNDHFAEPHTGTPIVHPEYRDPLPFAGKLGHPAALPSNGLMVVWGKGACSTVASHEIFEALGREVPPHVNGNGGGVTLNAITSLGMDTPGCDTGIYAATRIPTESPNDLQLIVDSRQWHEIQPRAVVAYRDIYGVDAPRERERADRATSHFELEVGTPFGLLGAASMTDRETHPLDGIHFAGEQQFNLQGTDTIDYTDDAICGVRILSVLPNRSAASSSEVAGAAGERIAILGEIPVRNRDGSGALRVDPSGHPDTSFLVRFPADMPYFMQGIDCEGRTLNTDQSWQALRPGEMKTCGGCHVHSRESRTSFGETFAATDEYRIPHLGEGRVPLLTGERDGVALSREVEGYGLQVDFSRDIMPIFERRCTSCHGGASPSAGLALDVPGIDANSTWWCLVRDVGQTCVEEPRRMVASWGTRMRRPQLTRYVRAFNALGSLLYWKAANRRTDGRTDAMFDGSSPAIDRDIDFGAEHPTDITPEELGLISRWIDLGSPGGPMELRDTQRPTLNLAGVIVNDAVAELRIGSVDIGTGIDPTSLEVCVSATGADDCTALRSGGAEMHGIVSVPLATPLEDRDSEVRVRVSDRAGNTTELRRTVGWLLNSPPPPPMVPDGGEALDGGLRNSDGAPISLDASMSGDGGVIGGCGCRVGQRTPPASLMLLMGLGCVVLASRRRTALRCVRVRQRT